MRESERASTTKISGPSALGERTGLAGGQYSSTSMTFIVSG